MKHLEFYRVPDDDDMGCCDTGSYLLVNSVGYYEFESYFRISHRKNGRKDFYLAYNHSGPMTVRIKGNVHVLEPGSIFLYRPFEEQYYGHYNENRFFSYWVHFTGYGVDELLIHAGLAESSVFHPGVSSNIANLYEEMINELQSKKVGYELALSSLLSYLFSMISRQIDIGHYGKMSESRKYVYESLKYIHKNYDKDISVRELAGMSHLSADRYAILFKGITGTSPQRYITSFRLQKACELMKRTNLNIHQISSMVGFEDQLYFSRIFRKHMNIKPSEYLAKYR